MTLVTIVDHYLIFAMLFMQLRGLLNVGQADVVFCKAARCGLGIADVFQLSTLESAPESIIVGITVQH